ncbi:unnamed protein product [Rotaria sordida]|uniref:Uncharacterized protein n=1 Tax=Rotaria sordida TaxID=392033 RepID=A0A818NZ18_9BILA|nr:unnamed protein product [Rotaria sordida]CAF3613097.1 unnamed protein product [Rotaria sordida]
MNFNVTQKIIRNHAETFIPITCQENAGVISLIHAIVWLILNESSKAEDEFNRSLHASHFLTSADGFIQSVIMGYIGLQYDDKSLLFNLLPSILTLSTKYIRLRNVLVHGIYLFDYTIDQSSMYFIFSHIYTNLLCITDNYGNQ